MNPTENQAPQPENPSSPIVGYCRATGKALTAADAEYVNGILYSKDYAQQNQLKAEPASPYSEPMLSVPKSTAEVSPGWAFVLGLIPGVGAIYNQQYAKGLFHIIVFAAMISIIDRPGVGGPFIGFLMAGWYFYMPFEAYHTAQKRQRGEKVDELSGMVNLPPGLQKLPLGPFLLIGFGFLFLLDNLGLLRIDEILRFWPVLMIAAGVILLMQRFHAVESIKEGGHVE
jgi:hypothetical protein